MHKIFPLKPKLNLLIIMVTLLLGIKTSYAIDTNTLPQNPQVQAGTADIQVAPHTIDITASDKAIIDWSSFSVGSGNSVNIHQPHASSILLNRVTGADPSIIQGNITANGQVWLVNRNGVLVGNGARIDAAGFSATTKDIANADFMAGKYIFSGDSQAPIILEGTIQLARPGGWTSFIGFNIQDNATLLAAPSHKIVLGGAQAFSISLDGDGFMQFAVDPNKSSESVRVQMDAQAKIEAPNGYVLLRTQDVQDTVQNVVEMNGVIEAKRVTQGKGGIIRLEGGAGSTVAVSGTLDVQGTTTKGGDLYVRGDTTVLNNSARFNASGDTGGGNAYVGATLNHKPNAEETTDMTGPLQKSNETLIAPGATIHADALVQGNGGQVDTWGSHQSTVQGTISVNGAGENGNGGNIDISGRGSMDFENATLHLKTGSGGKSGTIKFDPLKVFIAHTPDEANHPSAEWTYMSYSYILQKLALSNVSIAASALNDIDLGNPPIMDIGIENAGVYLTLTGPNDLILQSQGNINYKANFELLGNGNLYLKSGAMINGRNINTGRLIMDGGFPFIDCRSNGRVYIYNGNNTQFDNTVNDYYGARIFNSLTNTNYLFVLYKWIDNINDWQTIVGNGHWTGNRGNNYALNADIILADPINHNIPGPSSYTDPNARSQVAFTGYFDGDGHSITINRNSSLDFPGLFKVIQTPNDHTMAEAVRNLTVYGDTSSANIYANPNADNIGGIANRVDSGFLKNVSYFSHGMIARNNMGAIVGSMGTGGIDKATINVQGALSGYDDVGGITGSIGGGFINNVQVSVQGVGGHDRIGVLVGQNNGATITNTSVTSTDTMVLGNNDVGAFVGNQTGGATTILTMPNPIYVKGLGTNTGGFFGTVTGGAVSVQPSTSHVINTNPSANVSNLIGYYGGGTLGSMTNNGTTRGKTSANLGGVIGYMAGTATTNGQITGQQNWVSDGAPVKLGDGSRFDQTVLGNDYTGPTKHIGNLQDPNNLLDTWTIGQSYGSLINGILHFIRLTPINPPDPEPEPGPGPGPEPEPTIPAVPKPDMTLPLLDQVIDSGMDDQTPLDEDDAAKDTFSLDTSKNNVGVAGIDNIILSNT